MSCFEISIYLKIVSFSLFCRGRIKYSRQGFISLGQIYTMPWCEWLKKSSINKRARRANIRAGVSNPRMLTFANSVAALYIFLLLSENKWVPEIRMTNRATRTRRNNAFRYVIAALNVPFIRDALFFRTFPAPFPFHKNFLRISSKITRKREFTCR